MVGSLAKIIAKCIIENLVEVCYFKDFKALPNRAHAVARLTV